MGEMREMEIWMRNERCRRVEMTYAIENGDARKMARLENGEGEMVCRRQMICLEDGRFISGIKEPSHLSHLSLISHFSAADQLEEIASEFLKVGAPQEINVTQVSCRGIISRGMSIGRIFTKEAFSLK